MVKERKIVMIEYTAITLLWSFVIISPLFFMEGSDQDWRTVYIMWTECAIVGFAFLVNRLIFMPYLFFKRRYIGYILALIGIFILLSLFIFEFDGVHKILSIMGKEMDTPPLSGMHPPHEMPLHEMSGHMLPHNPPTVPINGSIIPPKYMAIILSAIVIALDMGLSISMKWIISEQKQGDIDRKRVEAQLTNLQSQVSPHFLMNTLNNIHALVDIDSQRAKQTIIELSNLMDYLLYESSIQERVSLQRELDFTCCYINLMRLRFSKQVKIEYTYNDNVPSVKIPPFLFLNFIENSFKYGVDLDQESYISIKFSFDNDHIQMTTTNSNHAENAKGRRYGLGISNSRKRLDLLYGDQYTLDVNDVGKIFYVFLKIPIL